MSLLQSRLAAAGYDVGTVDGHFGPRTREALVAFQEHAGIDPDGIAGPQTWHHLLPAEGQPTPAPTVTPAVDPQGLVLPATQGRATTFWNGHYTYRGRRDRDNYGKGAWGDANRPTDYMGAIQVGLKGGGDRWHNQKLLISDRDTGKQVVVAVQDKGPGRNTTAVLDLSPVAKEALGHSFMEDADVTIALANPDAPLGPVG